MKSTDLNIAFIHFNEEMHPSHQGFADAVNADRIQCRYKAPMNNPLGEFIGGIRGFPDQYDLLVAEGTRPLIALAGSNLTHDTPIIYLAGDGALYELNEGVQGRDSLYEYAKLVAGRYAGKGINALLSATVDGVIGVSEMMTEIVCGYLGDSIPYRTVHPYIQPNVYEQLESVDPALDAKTAVTIGQAAPYKNVDGLVKVWPTVRETHPDATLKVVGSGHPAWYGDVAGVERLGFVEDLREPLSKASLYVHPASIEAFGVTVVEAMLAGVPPLVTEMTGAKEAVVESYPNLVTSADANTIHSGISECFHQVPLSDASADVRLLGGNYNKTRQTETFRNEIKNLALHLL